MPNCSQVETEINTLFDALQDREGAPAPITKDHLRRLLVRGQAIPSSAVAHFKSKLSIKDASSHDRTSHFHVFVAWPTACDFSKAALDCIDANHPVGLVPVIPCLKKANEGRILDDHVAHDIREAHRMVALLNLKNANVTFELGYALGRGIPACPAALTADGRIPPWIDEADRIFKAAQIVVHNDEIQLLETLIRHEDPAYKVERGLLLDRISMAKLRGGAGRRGNR